MTEPLVDLDLFPPEEVVTTDITCPVCHWEFSFSVCYEDLLGVSAALAKAHAKTYHEELMDQMRMALPVIGEPLISDIRPAGDKVH
jgi:hypothetical protein